MLEQSDATFLVSFAFDSDDLLPDSHQALDSALEKLRDRPDSFASITGFTDSQGDDHYNLALSRKRADAVEQYLVDAGVARQRLQVEGRGVLTTPVDDQYPGAAFDMEPHRIVQIKLGSDLSQ
jgi:outer membrane protein OmpA-like peptidoglycan-associated protein